MCKGESFHNWQVAYIRFRMSKLEEVSRQFSKLQNDLTELVSSRQQLETQYQENKIVKDEFNKLGDDSKIYKLIGPVLLPQDNTEANLNVDKRIEFIEKEMYVVSLKSYLVSRILNTNFIIFNLLV